MSVDAAGRIDDIHKIEIGYCHHTTVIIVLLKHSLSTPASRIQFEESRSLSHTRMNVEHSEMASSH